MEKNKLPNKVTVVVEDSEGLLIPGKTIIAPFQKFTGRVGYTATGQIEIDNTVYKTRIYVFVSPLIKKKTRPDERKSRISKSGEYKSIRNLIETLVANDRFISKNKVDAAVKREYPTSSYITNPTGSHWSWYQTHVVKHGRFITIKKPRWAIGLDERVKKKMQKRKEERENI